MKQMPPAGGICCAETRVLLSGRYFPGRKLVSASFNRSPTLAVKDQGLGLVPGEFGRFSAGPCSTPA